MDGLRFKDLGVVQELVKMGADINAARHILFYIYFAKESAARASARVLRRHGLEVGVHAPWEKIPQWAVVAESRDRPVIPTFLRETCDICERLADKHGGNYDGWEAGLTDAERRANLGR